MRLYRLKGQQALHGVYWASLAADSLEKEMRFSGFIFLTHAQLGLW
ncbi:MAG TPA: hypothetical protein VJC08_05095 [bacterium]|nr:hypothetical protein [bacterium]